MPKSRQKKIKAVDPFCTGTRKALLFQKEKEFNQAPKNDTIQEVPGSFRNLLEASKMAKDKQRKKVQKIGSIEREPNESHNQFMQRVHRQAVGKLYHSGYNWKIDAASTKSIKTDAAEKKKKERFAVLKERMKGRDLDHKFQTQEKEFPQDHVQFGEVVSAPPVFSAKPRNSRASADKPGKRQLLLKTMLHQQPPEEAQGSHKRSHTISQDHASKVKKRKNMTIAEKRKFDRSREAAILAYRKTKGQRQDNVIFTGT